MIQFVLPIVGAWGLYKLMEHFDKGGKIDDLFEGHGHSGGVDTGDKPRSDDKPIHRKSINPGKKKKPKGKQNAEYQTNSNDRPSGGGDSVGSEQHAAKTICKSELEPDSGKTGDFKKEEKPDGKKKTPDPAQDSETE